MLKEVGQIMDNSIPSRDCERKPFNQQAVPPEEVRSIISQYQLIKGLSESEIRLLVPAWYPRPVLFPVERRLSRKDLYGSQIDASEVMEPFFGNSILDGTLRTMDVANGCGHQCDTCFADSALPSRLFSLDSLDRLFSTQHFLRILQPTSFRIGSTGDIADHPEGLEIVEMVLDRTRSLDEKRMKSQGEHHEIKVFTNYRKHNEDKLVRLIELADNADDRLQIAVSLPNNRVDTVNRQFREFARKYRNLLQWRPYNLFNFEGHMYTFEFHHPELLTGEVSEDLRTEFVDYLEKTAAEDGMTWRNGARLTRALIEKYVDAEIYLLPVCAREQGVDEYMKFLGKMARKTKYKRELHPGSTGNPHVGIQDVRTGFDIAITGRILSDEILMDREQLEEGMKAHHLLRDTEFYNRGLSKTFLNPDAQWIQIYATPIESYTNRVYAPLTPENLELLSQIPFHPDFPTPPNWPGGRGVPQRRDEDLQQARLRYKEIEAKMHTVR